MHITRSHLPAQLVAGKPEVREYPAIQATSRRKAVQLTNDLLQTLAQALVPDRPGRAEPRVIKRRHKRYSLMTRPRNYWKAHLRSRKTTKNQSA